MNNTKEKHLLTVSSSPHLHTHENSRYIMLEVVIALLPALIWGIYVFGTRALTLTLISCASCVIFEYLYQKLMKKPITILDFSAVVTGILLSFNLPPSVPLWLPIIGSFFAIVIVKQLFGGIGKNFANPALAARVFLFISWPTEMTTFTAPFERFSPLKISVDAVTAATPLQGFLKEGNFPEIPLFDMVIGNMPGTIGEISALLLVVGGIGLLIRKVITWHIPVSFIGTVGLLTLIFPRNPLRLDFMLYEICAGGLILGAIFMATDYSTSPMTKTGKLIFGAGCGLITVFIRYFGGYPEGVSFAILIMNLVVWYIDKFTKPKAFGGGFKNEK